MKQRWSGASRTMRSVQQSSAFVAEGGSARTSRASMVSPSDSNARTATPQSGTTHPAAIQPHNANQHPPAPPFSPETVGATAAPKAQPVFPFGPWPSSPPRRRGWRTSREPTPNRRRLAPKDREPSGAAGTSPNADRSQGRRRPAQPGTADGGAVTAPSRPAHKRPFRGRDRRRSAAPGHEARRRAIGSSG